MIKNSPHPAISAQFPETMRKIPKIICPLIAVCLIFGAGLAQAQKESPEELQALVKPETLEEYNARMAWFADAKYGMFIHFGLYSQLGGSWNGKESHYYAEWIQSKPGVPDEEYVKLIKTFNPTKFDAELIVTTAKQAGMKYLVITSKHHEGFCLWDSKYTEYDVGSTPFKGRDILDELNQACKKHGIKFGIYYSILDWHHPAQKRERHYSNIVEGKKQEYIDYQKNQVLELIEKYDPAVLWFDGDWCPWWTLRDGIDLYNAIRTASPTVICNNRVARREGFELDFVTQEQGHFDAAFPKHWEACYTTNKSWGYKAHDNEWKTAKNIRGMLGKINGRGGNLLLNVGPDGEGVVPQKSIDIILEVGKMLEASPAKKSVPEITKVPGVIAPKRKNGSPAEGAPAE